VTEAIIQQGQGLERRGQTIGLTSLTVTAADDNCIISV